MYLGIDLGTSGAKSILMDENQQLLASCSAPMTVSRPHDGWSEQNPAHWIEAVESTLEQLKADHGKLLSAVRGIGLSGQMHGATLLDQSDQVIRPCLLWNDTRSQKQADRLDTRTSRELTGNILFPGFTAPKLAWVAEHEPQNFSRTDCVLLPKDYLRLWLTGERVAEMSDAAGTGWLDVQARQWSDTLLKATGLERRHMPSLVEGTAASGYLRQSLAERFGIRQAVVVAGGAGDNAASACGMGTIRSGQAFLSLGTSGVLFAACDQYQPDPDSAIHTFCHALPNTWHQMGVILAATDALNWLGRLLGEQPAELTARLETGNAAPTDLLFLPYLGGERTPINDSQARGVFIGLKHTTDKAEMTQAVLQGVAFAFRDSLLALHATGTTIDRAMAIGGGAKSQWWLQLIANAVDICLDIPADGDYGASYGAARLGLIAAQGMTPETICTVPPIDRSVQPDTQAGLFQAQHERYMASYQALKPIMSSVKSNTHQ